MCKNDLQDTKKTLVCRKLRLYFHVTPVNKFGKLFINNAYGSKNLLHNVIIIDNVTL